jgi:hypothetical protein
MPSLASTHNLQPSERLNRIGSLLADGIVKGKPKATEDQLLFNKEDIARAKNPLLRLFRLICYKRNITLDDYRAMIYKYELAEGKTMAQVQTCISNTKKAIFGDSLTIMQFERNLNYIGLDIMDLIVITRDEEGELITYATSDSAKLVTSIE